MDIKNVNINGAKDPTVVLLIAGKLRAGLNLNKK